MVAPNLAKETQSVLDSLVARTVKTKENKAARLTPTASESAVSPLASHLPSFPFDSPETMLAALKVARIEVVHVLEGIDRLLATFGGEAGSAPVVDAVAEAKARERAADEAHFARQMAQEVEFQAGPGGDGAVPFALDFAQKQAEAQAAAFRTGGEPAVETKEERVARLRRELEELD